MLVHTIGADALGRALSLRDLTDRSQGLHAMQQLLAAVETALGCAWGVRVQRYRGHPVVTVADNYERLRFPADSAARDPRHTRYVSEGRVLRTHTSAMIPPLLTRLAAWPPEDVLLSCPGLVYRRDAIDRRHAGEPHQVDLWRVRRRPRPLDRGDLRDMVAHALVAALPGRTWRVVDAEHPYTLAGWQIDVDDGGTWVEVGECGLAHPEVLADCGHDPSVTSGLAMGLGLDRLLMLRKGIDDIRLLRSPDPRVAGQMRDLSPYRPVSAMPAVRRDLSVAVAADTSAEQLGDRVRSALGDTAAAVETVEVLAETPAAELPPAAKERLGLRAGQKNALVRVVLRDLQRTLTDDEANSLRDRVFAAVHEGDRHLWARPRPAALADRQ